MQAGSRGQFYPFDAPGMVKTRGVWPLCRGAYRVSFVFLSLARENNLVTLLPFPSSSRPVALGLRSVRWYKRVRES